MQIPLLHGKCHNKATYKKKNDVVEVYRRYHLPLHYSQQGKQHHGKQGGGRNGNRFGNPPDRHQQRHRRGAGHYRVPRIEIKKQQDDQRGQRAADESDSLLDTSSDERAPPVV